MNCFSENFRKLGKSFDDSTNYIASYVIDFQFITE